MIRYGRSSRPVHRPDGLPGILRIILLLPDLQGLVGLDRSGIQKYGSGGIQKVGGMKTGIDLKSHVDQKWYEQRMKYQITVGGQKVESRKVKISFAVMPGYQ